LSIVFPFIRHGPIVPTEIDRLRKVNWFPRATAALLALLALIAVAHRRRD
jgi:hypothetical protein